VGGRAVLVGEAAVGVRDTAERVGLVRSAAVAGAIAVAVAATGAVEVAARVVGCAREPSGGDPAPQAPDKITIAPSKALRTNHLPVWHIIHLIPNIQYPIPNL
jgi:hypothetical protein